MPKSNGISEKYNDAREWLIDYCSFEVALVESKRVKWSLKSFFAVPSGNEACPFSNISVDSLVAIFRGTGVCVCFHQKP